MSGAVFGGFLSLHLINAMTASFGENAYESTMGIFRKVYQPHPIFEIVVIGGSAIVHMATAFVRIRNRRKISAGQNTGTEFSIVDFAKKLHRYAGYYLATFIGGHVFFTRGPFFKMGVPGNFGVVANGLFNLPVIFYPYYTLLGISGLYHLTYGAIQASKVLGYKPPAWTSVRSRTFWTWIGFGSAFLFSAVLAFGGNYFPVQQE
eukprot:CAMPEP_0168569942 /NCGR_PEP_ID=MMETSP0413-20121227/16451_1 /TAXON_ID=136452 /ORGANISM="Filamoeba nolandi, Strain NC-AS-23-1" /LENGTH=204 /DNA_ID=CAMNT_0008602521 /DNA_START=97 /DNA_END=708 /DNA_ORIENTATION=-